MRRNTLALLRPMDCALPSSTTDNGRDQGRPDDARHNS
jgi:hypothetical protein